MMVFNHNILIISITSLLFVAVTAAASSCTETSYLGYNTDFVNIYNTKNGTESPGDTWTWHANVTSDGGDSDEFNPDLLVGELVGYCIRTPAGFWECDETIIMNGSSLYVHYVQKPPATQSTAGILGGTGSYKSGVSGQIVFTAPSTDNGPWGIDMELCMPSSTSSSSPLMYGGRKLPALLFGLLLFL